jgi:secondary thiamine-phosphate synthase enzyme
MKQFNIKTHGRTEFLNIDREVQGLVEEAGAREGVCRVFVPHTTAGLTINENADPDVIRDITSVLDRLVPWEADYKHTEGNSAAHVKASMMGSSVTVFIREGRLTMGTWQSIFFCEFDGPRTRNVWVEITEV